MSARNGLAVDIQRQASGKLWMIVKTTKPDGAAPSFYDWYCMIAALRICEADKYPHSHDPLRIPREFFAALFDDPMPTYKELAAKFKIPDRGQDVPLIIDRTAA